MTATSAAAAMRNMAKATGLPTRYTGASVQEAGRRRALVEKIRYDVSMEIGRFIGHLSEELQVIARAHAELLLSPADDLTPPTELQDNTRALGLTRDAVATVICRQPNVPEDLLALQSRKWFNDRRTLLRRGRPLVR